MIVLEGPDGSGKSTLAQFIQTIYPTYPIIHSPGPCPEDVFKERTFWNKELCEVKELIIDRISIVSEVIYGTVLRGKSFISEQQIRDFFGQFYQKKYNILIYCNQNFTAIKKDNGALYLGKKEKMLFEDEVEDNITLIRKAYQEYFTKWRDIFRNVQFIEITSFEDYIKLFEILRRIQNECK